MTFDSNDVKVLKRELVGMFGHIQRIRRELAAISRPSEKQEGDHFFQMSDQLDAIVESTEEATNEIMTNVEEIQDLIGNIRESCEKGGVQSDLDSIADKANRVFEACSFQDLTGQRVTKVVHSLKFIEERVNALIRMWGKDELEKVVVEINQDRDPEAALLNGPQRKGKGVSQHDVDQMLGEPKIELDQNDIDKLFG